MAGHADGLVVLLGPASDVGREIAARRPDRAAAALARWRERAETVIEVNTVRRPSWKFLAGDFLKLRDQHRFRADLVLCFDVLIHQHEFATYEAFVRAIVASCGGIALVGAFQTPPRPQYRSEITAYHEPITRTLARCRVKSMRIVASYRDTVVVEFARVQSLCV